MLEMEKKTPLPSIKKIFLGYFIIVIVLVIISLGVNKWLITVQTVELFGLLLMLLEGIIGMIAAGTVGFLTSLDTIYARGEPITRKTVFQQRLKDEEHSHRKPWLILLGFNTLIMIILFWVSQFF